MKTFGELLTEYMRRTGISDAELARSISVSRITIFRWKEGSVARPRVREDVLRCAVRLRLTPEESDLLLLAAGFAPESPATIALPPLPSSFSSPVLPPLPLPPLPAPENLPLPSSEFEAPTPEIQEAERDENVNRTTINIQEQGVSREAKVHKDGAERDNRIDQTKDSTIKSSTQPAPFPYLYRVAVALGALLIIGLSALIARGSDIFNRSIPTPTPVSELVPTQTTIIINAPQTISPAQNGELLIILAEFTNKTLNQNYDVPERLKEALRAAFKRSKQIPRIEILRTPIEDESKATQWLTKTNATVIFWGEYDSGRVVTYILDRHQSESSKITRPVDSPNNLAVVINDVAPNDVKRWATAWAYLIQSKIYLGNRWQDLQQGINSVDLQQGISALQDAIKDTTVTDEMKAYAYLNEGTAYLNAKSQDTDSARIALEKALQLNPTTVETKASVLFYLGYLSELEASKDRSVELWSQAIEYYNQALALKPAWSNIRFNRGNAYYGRSQLAAKDSAELQADLDAALVDFSQVLTQKPENAGAYWNRATTYYDRNQADDQALAAKDIAQAVRLTAPLVVTGTGAVSSSVKALADQYFMVGLIKLRQTPPGDWEMAFHTMHEILPTSSDTLMGLCWGHAVTGNAQAALSECESLRTQATAGFPRNADAYAIALGQTGRYSEAVAALELHITWLRMEPPQLYERYNGLLIDEWLVALRQEKNPFTAEMLERLRLGQ